jgi:thiamine kinase
VETSAGRFIVRVHNPSADALGADHEREARLHAAAAAAGLAPALVHVDARFGFMVMEQVPGPTWVAEDFGRADRLGQLGAALHALHSVPAPTVTPFDLESSLVRLAARLTTRSSAEAPEVGALMDRARAALRLTGASQRPAAIVHNDLYHGNLIGSDRLYLVDWEYAAVADPLLDLACVLAYYPQAGAHRDTLMDSSRLSRVASPEMLGSATWLFMLVSYFWYRIRRLDGPVPETDVAAERDLRIRLG